MGTREADCGGGACVVGVAVGAGCVAVGLGACVGAWVGACVGAGVAVGSGVGGVLVAVGAGLMAVAAGEAALSAALEAGCGVGVGDAALSAVLEDGLRVAVGSGSSSSSEEDCFATSVAVAVGEARAAAAVSGASESSADSSSSGAAGGGLSRPLPEGSETPARLTAGVPGAGSSERAATNRPPEIASVPVAKNAMASVLGLMAALLARVPAGSLEAASVQQTEGVVFESAAHPWAACLRWSSLLSNRPEIP
jgi:hypothetical protein